eukprot:Platyproteum_vivax@DN10460_c0_g1_i1.p1
MLRLYSAFGRVSSVTSSRALKIWHVARTFSTLSVSGNAPPPPYFDGEFEVLTPEQQLEKEQLIKELTKRLSGPLADENGNVPTGKDRPTAIEVDGPSHYYANSTRCTAYTKLKHRLLTRMGYRVLHVPYFEWRKLRGAKEREEYMRDKLKEDPSEWLDPEDEKYYNQRMQAAVEAAKQTAASPSPEYQQMNQQRQGSPPANQPPFQPQQQNQSFQSQPPQFQAPPQHQPPPFQTPQQNPSPQSFQNQPPQFHQGQSSPFQAPPQNQTGQQPPFQAPPQNTPPPFQAPPSSEAQWQSPSS